MIKVMVSVVLFLWMASQGICTGLASDEQPGVDTAIVEELGSSPCQLSGMVVDTDAEKAVPQPNSIEKPSPLNNN